VSHTSTAYKETPRYTKDIHVAKFTHLIQLCWRISAHIASKTYLVSSATRIYVPWGTTRPRWARKRQFVGPQCGQTWVPACITLNLAWPRRQSRAAGNSLISWQVKGALRQLAAILRPKTRLRNTSINVATCRQRLLCGQHDRSPRSYSRVSRPESLIFLPSSSSIALSRLSRPRSRPTHYL
jgi:hypothetical protein